MWRILIGYEAGVWIARASGISLPGAWGIATGTTLLTAWVLRQRGTASWVVLAACLMVGTVRGAMPEPDYEGLRQRAPFLREITGTVASYPDIGRTWQSFDLRLAALDGTIRVTIWDGADVPERIVVGDVLRVQGVGQIPEVTVEFDDLGYLERQGVFARFSVGEDDTVECIGSEPSVWRAGDALRQRMMARVADGLREDEAALALGLLFGMDGLLATEDREAFRATGVAHLLAVSGLHLGLLLAVVWAGLRVLRLRPAVAYACIMLAAAAAVWIIGPRTSLVRATLMVVCSGSGMALADLGVISRRWVDPLRGIGFAAMMILLVNPDAWQDVSFQLSFAATAAIVGGWRLRATKEEILHPSGAGGRLRGWMRNLAVVSLWAQVGVVPVVAFQFGTFHPMAVAWNLVAVPWATVCLWTEAAFVAFARTPLGSPVAAVLEWGLARFRGLMLLLGKVPISQVPVSPAMAAWVTGLITLCVGVYGLGSSSWSSTLKSTSMVCSWRRVPLRVRGPWSPGVRRRRKK